MEIKQRKNSKLTLKDYYEQLKIAELSLVDKIAKECGVTRRTVYNWINGMPQPPVLAQEKINELLGKKFSYEN